MVIANPQYYVFFEYDAISVVIETAFQKLSKKKEYDEEFSGWHLTKRPLSGAILFPILRQFDEFIAFFSDAPYCKPGQVQVFGVARDETARIGCEVIANPQSSVFFEWRFNTSGETVDMPHDRFRSTNSR